jgi:predicted RNA-binding protein (virulence factor B family)
MATIGKRNTLKVLRDSKPGLYLDGGELGEILLPNRYVPRTFSRGDRLEVFVYRDSEDRLVATTETPRAGVGDVASLRVVSLHDRMGAFLDWGLSKDLLLPFREQTRPLAVGQAVTVRIYLDPKTQRIVASMRLERGAEKAAPDASLDQAGYQRVAPLAAQIVAALQRQGGRLALDDDSPPEAIRQAFGASKKAFKQALGALYKARRIRFSNPGLELLDNSRGSPGSQRPDKERGRA